MHSIRYITLSLLFVLFVACSGGKVLPEDPQDENLPEQQSQNTETPWPVLNFDPNLKTLSACSGSGYTLDSMQGAYQSGDFVEARKQAACLFNLGGSDKNTAGVYYLAANTLLQVESPLADAVMVHFFSKNNTNAKKAFGSTAEESQNFIKKFDQTLNLEAQPTEFYQDLNFPYYFLVKSHHDNGSSPDDMVRTLAEFTNANYQDYYIVLEHLSHQNDLNVKMRLIPTLVDSVQTFDVKDAAEFHSLVSIVTLTANLLSRYNTGLATFNIENYYTFFKDLWGENPLGLSLKYDSNALSHLEGISRASLKAIRYYYANFATNTDLKDEIVLFSTGMLKSLDSNSMELVIDDSKNLQCNLHAILSDLPTISVVTVPMFTISNPGEINVNTVAATQIMTSVYGKYCQLEGLSLNEVLEDLLGFISSEPIQESSAELRDLKTKLYEEQQYQNKLHDKIMEIKAKEPNLTESDIADLAELEAEMEKSKQRVSELENAINNYGKNAPEANLDPVPAAQQMIDELKTNLLNSENELELLKQNLLTAEQDLVQLQNDPNPVFATINTKQEEINDLKSKIAVLEAKINSMKAKIEILENN